MIETKNITSKDIKHAYNLNSWIYSQTVSRLEWRYHLLALEKANVQAGEKVLEVAVGPGFSFQALAERVGKDTPIYGVDLSKNMIDRTAARLQSNGFSNFRLREADSRQLPFEDNAFDLVYNGYMLDLIPEEDMPIILSEFNRVLRPGGRMVLLNLSKRDEKVTLSEKIFQRMPAKLTLYLLGGCRPVLMEELTKSAGFINVDRTYFDGVISSEIVFASKP